MSLRKSINEFCKSCIYDKYQQGTWRQQVTECPSKTCALYAVRPTSKSKEVGNEQELEKE